MSDTAAIQNRMYHFTSFTDGPLTMPSPKLNHCTDIPIQEIFRKGGEEEAGKAAGLERQRLERR